MKLVDMRRSTIILASLAIAIQAQCMLIPQDIEILDGYELDGSPEIYPEETYFEARALADSLLLKAIRNKRSYHVLQSPGLHSHFLIDPNYVEKHTKQHNQDENQIRSRRSIENTQSHPIDTIDTENETPPSLPTPEKQVMESEYYTKGNWNVKTFNTDYNSNNQKSETDDIDSVPDATVNEGIKSRQPRVNFITQPKKDPTVEERSNDRLSNFMTKLNPTVTKSRYEKVEPTVPETYPSRSYDQYLRRYDSKVLSSPTSSRYDDDYMNYNNYNRYDPYEDYYLHRRRYDPYDSYSPRTPTYPDEYYAYPDSRYDVPEPRTYRQLYSNDIYERNPSYSPTYSPPYDQSTPIRRRNRIIYYAHLPEVVRAPPTVDLTYRHGREHRFGGYYPPSNNYQMSPSSPSRGKLPPEYIKRDKKDYRLYEAGNKQSPRSEGNARE